MERDEGKRCLMLLLVRKTRERVAAVGWVWKTKEEQWRWWFFVSGGDWLDGTTRRRPGEALGGSLVIPRGTRESGGARRIPEK